MRTILDRLSDDLIGSARRRDVRGALIGVIEALTFLMALAATAALIARWGFYLEPRLAALAERVGRLVLYGFLVQAALKLAIVRRRRLYLRTHVVEMVLIALLLAILLFPAQIGAVLKAWNPLLAPESLANLYVAITQASLLIAFVPAGLRASKRLMSAPVQPALLIVLSFVLLILAGTGALLLPRATAAGRISFVDALFTATSASCVTGLAVVDTGSSFSSLGRTVILVLMQAGGLGIMTLTTFFAGMVGRRGSLKEYATLQALFGEESIGTIRGAAGQIALTTIGFELAGAALIWLTVDPGLFPSSWERLFFALFHAVSAFCNAGFCLLPDGLATPALRGDTGFLVVTMVLIVAGGLGFTVLRNLARAADPRRVARGKRRLTLHTRIVLVMTALLLAAGAVAFGILEASSSLRGEAPGARVLHAVFQSVTARTAGFNTVPMGALATPTALLLIALMWIGASPGSTGGGIKTTSIALVMLETRAATRGRDRVELLRARVDPLSLSRAHSTVFVSLVIIAAGFFALTLTERQPLLALLFETFSAAGTVGLSVGITPLLGTAGRIVVVVLMFAGRVGFLTLAIALTRRAAMPRVDYASESVPVL